MCKLTAGEFEMFGTRADDVAAVLGILHYVAFLQLQVTY